MERLSGDTHSAVMERFVRRGTFCSNGEIRPERYNLRENVVYIEFQAINLCLAFGSSIQRTEDII